MENYPRNVVLLKESPLLGSFAYLNRTSLVEIVRERTMPRSADRNLEHCNMCNLEHLNLLRDSLPLDGERSQVWLKKNKVIDGLHIKKTQETRVQDWLCTKSSCSWFSRSRSHGPGANILLPWTLQKVLNTMPKTYFHFVLHRLIILRNRYTKYCYSVQKYPLLPSAKVERHAANSS